MRGSTIVGGLAAVALACGVAAPALAADKPSDLWQMYDQVLSKSRYIDLTHTITPNMPVWKGFGPATFSPTTNPLTGMPYTFAADGFEATHYDISTDQFGTQLDPPAHWAPEYPAIDELPATFAAPRPLVVISIVDQVKKKGDYHLQVSDITAWEKKWTSDPAKAVALAADPVFPGVSLDAIKFLQLKRHILFHGHEPLDTDTTPTLEGEAWLMHHGYAQGEGVANLDKVPETGCLVSTGFPRFKGGTGGLVSYTAICPPGVKGDKISRADAPLKKLSPPLHW